ncbi:MAG TPA: hypothetical protein VF765_27215 [Polyangiaceae bacterium]
MALALVLRARRMVRWLVLPAAGLAASVASGCFTAGQGTQPPMKSFYFPTGLAVSPDGKFLYAVNSDFDLQWNGGTLQSYDLARIRQTTADLVKANASGAKTPPASLKRDHVNFVPNCMQSAPQSIGNQLGVHVGANCAPPVDSTQYVLDSAIVGAFAEDLQVGDLPGAGCPGNCSLRLFAPMAGNSTVTWADVGSFKGTTSSISCGRGSDNRCDALHQTGNDPNSPGNTRQLTMPGEPYGMAISEDKASLAVTSETDTKSSLLTTTSSFTKSVPTMQFVVENLPSGGIGMASVPHDPNAVVRCQDVSDREYCIRPAFLETFVGAAEVDLLRYYDDDQSGSGSSTYRPFLVRERAVSIPTNIGADFRGLAIDPTPRYRCAASATTQDQRLQCGRLPARVFIASRTPPSVVYADLGLYTGGGEYDPDALAFLGNIPLPAGPSKVYLAPIIIQDTTGAHYEPRIFVTLFDTGAIEVINPELVPPVVEATVYVGQNPYSLAFDPFGDQAVAAGNTNAPSMTDIATHKQVPPLASADPHRYRFAYVGIFTQSYVQMIDLDDSAFTGTYQQVVFNLGVPTIPKGQANNNNSGSFL